jgi:hypothetical protein
MTARLPVIPYKLLVMLMYGQYSWLTWHDGRGRVVLGKLSRLLNTNSTRTKQYLKWLAERGYLEDVYTTSRLAWFTPVLPPNPSWDMAHDEYSLSDLSGGCQVIMDLEAPRRDEELH